MMKHTGECIDPGFEEEADITRSPNQRYQWRHKKERKEETVLWFSLSFNVVYWWLVAVTLVVAFSFLSPNFGRCQGPTNVTLL